MKKTLSFIALSAALYGCLFFFASAEEKAPEQPAATVYFSKTILKPFTRNWGSSPPGN